MPITRALLVFFTVTPPCPCKPEQNTQGKHEKEHFTLNQQAMTTIGGMGSLCDQLAFLSTR